MKPYLSIHDCQLLNEASLHDSPVLVKKVIQKKRYFYHYLSKIFNYNPLLEQQAFVRMIKLMMTSGSFNALEVLFTDIRFLGDRVAPTVLAEAVYAMDIPRYAREMDCHRLIVMLSKQNTLFKYPVPVGFLGHAVRLKNHALVTSLLKRDEVNVHEQNHRPLRYALMNHDLPMLATLFSTKGYQIFFKQENAESECKHIRAQYESTMNLFFQYVFNAKEGVTAMVADFLIYHPTIKLNENAGFMKALAKTDFFKQSKALYFAFDGSTVKCQLIISRECGSKEKSFVKKVKQNKS